MTTWMCAALVIASSLSFWAGVRVERKRNELQAGMAATLDAIDRERRGGLDEDGREEDSASA